jgi:hypothetical protein
VVLLLLVDRERVFLPQPTETLRLLFQHHQRFLVRRHQAEEKNVSIDHTRHCIKPQLKIKKLHVRIKFNSPSDPSLSFHIVVGTGRYTTSTTNMYHYNKSLTHRIANGTEPIPLVSLEA